MVRLGRQDLILTIDGTEYSNQCTNVELRSQARESGTVTFGGSSATSRSYVLALTFIQQTTTASLLDLLWSSVGEQVDVAIRPAGGSTTASADNPIWTGTVVVSEPDGALVGGSASASDEFQTSVEWSFLDRPVRTVA